MADYTYEFDPTGALPANLITNEEHTIAAVTGRDFNVFFPSNGPFFNDPNSLVVTNASGVPLSLGVDYIPVYKFQEASRQTAKDIYAGILIYDRDFAGLVKVTYQTLGGIWAIDMTQIIERLAITSLDPRVTTYEMIQNMPATFPPIDHVWDLDNLRTKEDILDALYAIAYSIGAETGGSIGVHLLDTNNPHNVTASQVGLGSVLNFGIASTLEAEEGISNIKYMTPALTKQAITAQIGLSLSDHLGGINPHNVTAAQIGLGAVVNGRMATDLEAADGTSTVLYINPANLAYVISTGVGQTLTDHAAGRNPHGTTADDVGLGAVVNGGMAANATAFEGVADNLYINPANLAYVIQTGIRQELAAHAADLTLHSPSADAIGLGDVVNGRMATDTEALAGTATDLYINPANLAYTIAQGVGQTLTAHVGASNPHGTTADDVGLGAVVDGAMATDLEALAGTATDLYINPANLAYVITNGIGVTLSAHTDASNPHGTTADDVGLGAVDNFATASDIEAAAGTAVDRFLTPHGGTVLVNEAMSALTNAAVLAYAIPNNQDATPVWVSLGAFTGTDTEDTGTVFEMVSGDEAGVVPPRISVNIEGSVDAFQAELISGDLPGVEIGYADIGGGGEITTLTEPQTFTNVSIGGMHLLAIKTDNTIGGYGYEMGGEITNMEALPGPIVQVWAGQGSSGAKDADGNFRFVSAYNATIETDLAPLTDIKDVIALDSIMLLNDNTLRFVGSQWDLKAVGDIPTGGRDVYEDLRGLTNVKQLVFTTNTIVKEAICLKQDNTISVINLNDRYCLNEYVAALPTTSKVALTATSTAAIAAVLNADNTTDYFGDTNDTPTVLTAATDATWIGGALTNNFFAFTRTDGTLVEDGELHLTSAAGYASSADHIVVTPYGTVIVNTDGTVLATIGDANWDSIEPTTAGFTSGKAWLEAQTGVVDVAWGFSDWGWCAVITDGTVAVFDDTTEMGAWLATQTNVAKVVFAVSPTVELTTYVIYQDGTVGVKTPTGGTDTLNTAALTNVKDIQVDYANAWGCALHNDGSITPLMAQDTYRELSGLNFVASQLGNDVADITVTGNRLLITRISGGQVIYTADNTEALYRAADLINVHRLQCAGDILVAHHTDLTVTVFGNDNNGYVTLLQNAGLTNVVQVSVAGENFGFLTGDLVVHAYGADAYSELSRIDGQTNAIGISFSANGTAALLKDGTIITYSQVADMGY